MRIAKYLDVWDSKVIFNAYRWMIILENINFLYLRIEMKRSTIIENLYCAREKVT